MTNLTNKKRKELTIFLGECWHEQYSDGDLWRCRCGFDYCPRGLQDNGLFTTPDDMAALAKRMVEKGVWEEFIDKAIGKFYHSPYWSGKGFTETQAIIAYLLTDPARFCWLVSEFLEKEIITCHL